MKIFSDKEEEEQNSSGKLTSLSGLKHTVSEDKENRSHCMSNDPILYGKIHYKIGQEFLDIL